MATTTAAQSYSMAHETNGLVNPAAYHEVDRSVTVEVTDPRLARITRARYLTDPGFPVWDESYVHGVLKDGTPVRVHMPQWQISKTANGRRRSLAAGLVQMAIDNGFNARRLGLLDAISTLD